jgi:mannobiose 2-epimerase
MNLTQLSSELSQELTGNILPFWSHKMVDTKNGGFWGRINGNGNVLDNAPKGGILNARILWTFSAAYNLLKKPEYLETATRAKNYIFDYFFDNQYGGTYWSITAKGKPLDTKKQIYSQAFFIYALSEYYQATAEEQCLHKAIELFHLIEKYSFDNNKNGYFEAYSRDWILLDDLRLSEKDANEKKTMNTHLHILEAYTNLYRVWGNDLLERQLRNLINVFLEKIIDKQTSHLNLFFDEYWNCKSKTHSYGHDIEASWLIYEAALVVGDSNLIGKTCSVCVAIAKAATEGLQNDGSLIYEKDHATGHIDFDRHWWVQAEAVVGYFNTYELTRNAEYLTKAENTFAYIKANLIDKKNGEWHWSVKADGSINITDDKAGFWKCPYHNGRMCIELMTRINY